GFGQDDRRQLEPPPLRFPPRLTAGKEWSGSYHAGDLPITFQSRVLRRDAVEVDGRRYAGGVVRTVSDTGGVQPGTRVDSRWWSPRLALSLRWGIEMRIGGPASLRTTADLQLATAVPLT